jgi:hypothetical protein
LERLCQWPFGFGKETGRKRLGMPELVDPLTEKMHARSDTKRDKSDHQKQAELILLHGWYSRSALKGAIEEDF